MGNKSKICSLVKENIVRDYTDNFLTTTELAGKYGFNVKTITKILKSENIELCKISPFRKEYWIKRGMSEKDVVNKISTLRPSNVNYWINKGYSPEESVIKVSENSLKTKDSVIAKYGEIKGEEIWSERIKQRVSKNPVSLKYWLDKGYSEDEAKGLRSKRQTTFTKEKCIARHGIEDGLKRWELRQEKWVDSLASKTDSELYEINKKKASKSIDSLKQKYGETWLVDCLGTLNVNERTKEFIRYCFFNLENIEDVVNYTVSKYEYVSHSVLKALFPKILLSYYNIDFNSIKALLIEKYNIYLVRTFGVIRQINGYITKSGGEYDILKFLIENNINFTFEQLYPNQNQTKYKFDFKIENEYFEYTGMLKIKNKKSKSRFELDTLEKYEKRLVSKCEFCFDRGYNMIISSDSQKIIEYINNKYVKKKENNTSGLLQLI
jgi:hypothetical protein